MSTALARRFKVDVSLDNITWTPFKGIVDLNPKISPNLQAADDYDSNGWEAKEKVLQGWVVTIKALRKTISGTYDAGQELVRTQMLNFGDTARVFVRWYDRTGAPEAFSGWAIVQYEPSKTAVTDLDEVTVTLTGDGILNTITNPFVPTAIPQVVTVTPSGQAATQAVRIIGSNFTGTVVTTGVKFGGVNAASWVVVSDSEIIAVLPAGSAGLQTALVTNAIGGSTATNNYTRA